MSQYLFTSESVTEGHPDKLCDQISDAVLDHILAQDPNARVACETFATTGSINIMGEITTDCYVDIPAVAREIICGVGYNDPSTCFDGNTCAVTTSIHEQSPDIAMGVDAALETRDSDQLDTGAGDQGMMFGYACNETPELMPATISYAHRLVKALSAARRSGLLPYLRPDGKSQVTLRFEDGRPVAVDAVVLSTQHDEAATLAQIRQDMIEKIILPNLPENLLDEKTKFFVNPTGRFCLGGPAADTGLTGRKIIVDTYGGYARHGGGAFSGKDPTKVDRSAAYMARYIAKNIVAAGLADKCELQLAYAIGVAQPVSVFVDTFGTNHVSNEKITSLVREHFDLRPRAIIEYLGLRRPIYTSLAAFGHMGREDLGVRWEDTDMAATLRVAL